MYPWLSGALRGIFEIFPRLSGSPVSLESPIPQLLVNLVWVHLSSNSLCTCSSFSVVRFSSCASAECSFESVNILSKHRDNWSVCLFVAACPTGCSQCFKAAQLNQVTIQCDVCSSGYMLSSTTFQCVGELCRSRHHILFPFEFEQSSFIFACYFLGAYFIMFEVLDYILNPVNVFY